MFFLSVPPCPCLSLSSILSVLFQVLSGWVRIMARQGNNAIWVGGKAICLAWGNGEWGNCGRLLNNSLWHKVYTHRHKVYMVLGRQVGLYGII